MLTTLLVEYFFIMKEVHCEAKTSDLNECSDQSIMMMQKIDYECSYIYGLYQKDEMLSN